MSSKQYYKYIDMAKGFSIIMIVMGHIETTLYPFILWQRFFSLFHVPIFFAISGLTISNEKVKKTGSFILGKTKNIYLKGLIFYIPAVLLHNLFCEIGFYNAALYPGETKHELYTMKEMLKQVLLTFGCAGREPVLSAMWFIFVLFFALCGYSVLSGILSKFLKNEKTYEGTRTILIWLALVFSAFLTNHYQFTIQRFSNVFAAIALIHTGYLLRNYRRIKFDNWAVMIISLIGLIQNMEYGYVQMNVNNYGNPVFLLSNAFFGTYLICFISCKCEKFKWSDFITLCGKHSFYIMALHMLAFKLLTVVLQKTYSCTVELGRIMPNTSVWWELILYITTGVLFPIGVGKAVCGILDRVENRKDVRSK